jgi:hypothetical protein
MPIVGSAPIQPWRCHQPIALRAMDSSRLTVSASIASARAAARPLRARDLCLALDLPVLPKHVEGTRGKLKRLVGLGFLDESEPGLFAQPRP